MAVAELFRAPIASCIFMGLSEPHEMFTLGFKDKLSKRKVAGWSGGRNQATTV
jgi:hypothetical protein